MAPMTPRTPPHGQTSPTATAERARALLSSALEDERRGNLQSAETNLRLATAFGASGEVTKALERVVEARERARRKAAGVR